MSESTQQLRAHIREIGKLAEVVGALSKEFERAPRVEVLATMKDKVALLCEEWAKAEKILSSKQNG
jgi:hypothetical protein